MHRRLTNLEREIDEIKAEDGIIRQDIERIKRELVDKTPEHFGQKDVIRSFMGSLFLAFSVAFSSNVLNAARQIPQQHIILVVVFTIIILTAEIYFIGYQRVDDKEHRKFGQFWIKRLIAFYVVALIVSFILTYIFGLVYLVDSPQHFYNLIILITAPASIGASISDLLKKY
ncbi:MAG: DUF2391 family protein [Candidatus Woesearchaeota archaeon]